jgi:hypothetical protein
MDVQKGSNNNIDQIVRAKLNSLAPQPKRGSWEQLSKRLDAAEQADLFDHAVGERVEEIKVPYQQSSWAILAARLELERMRMRAIVHYKAMETSLLLLLFITAWQLLPITTEIPSRPLLDPDIPIAAASISDEEWNLTKEPLSQDVNSTTTEESKAYESVLFSEKTTANSSFDQQYAHVNSADKELIAANNGLKSFAQREKIDAVDLLPPSALSIIEVEKNAQQQLMALQAQKTENLNSPTDRFQRNGALAALEAGALNLLDYGSPEELLEYIRPNERQTFVRIGFVGSPDYNRVVTPLQEIDNGEQVSYDRYSLGYSGGLTLGVEHGKWEVETGAIYAARRYQAIPTVYVSGNFRDGYTGVSLRDFELNTVNIPLNFRYNFILHNKWRLYAQGGASFNIVLDANYYTVDKDAFSGLNQNSNLNSSNGLSRAEKPESLLNKNLTAGWIEGGSLLENATFYGDIGVGLERYMTPSWSMFVQPTYHHSFQIFNEGLGPYQDRIYNFGVGIGLKVRL